MKAGATLFRFRMIVMAAVIFVGFWAPWVQFWAVGSRITLLEWLALEISRTGLVSFTVATPLVIVCGSLIAALGAVLRIWGSAWLGPGVVINAQMLAGSLMADGPYRYLRNPLYLGMMCMIAALGLLMPASGALFVFIAVPLLVFALIAGEESFLAAQFGEPYRVYLLAVPRLVPRLRTTLGPSGNNPRWLQAVLSEITPIGVFITIAFISWTYDNRLMVKAVIVTFGLSLIVRALMPGQRQPSTSPQ
jgi:protein-S-isoprenylcysteine O-methyltransferase Ste14